MIKCKIVNGSEPEKIREPKKKQSMVVLGNRKVYV
jgi:hypothetical protein